MKLIYIAGPYRSETERGVYENIHRARLRAEEVWRAGACAVCPQLNSAFMGGLVLDYVFLEGAMEMMRRCDAILTVDGWTRSEGSIAEVEEAKRLGLPVFNRYIDFYHWLEHNK